MNDEIMANFLFLFASLCGANFPQYILVTKGAKVIFKSLNKFLKLQKKKKMSLSQCLISEGQMTSEWHPLQDVDPKA